jgi:hypothetical protein
LNAKDFTVSIGHNLIYKSISPVGWIVITLKPLKESRYAISSVQVEVPLFSLDFY